MSRVFRSALRKLGIVPTHQVTIQRAVKVPMPDGPKLVTDLYLGNPSGAPVIMIRSPFGRNALFTAVTAYPLASQGYNVVMQSCRGTFGSTGEFDPHHDEHRDGLATLEWIKEQPWCNGSIATFGMSYLGYTQWAVAAAAGPEVKAMAMQVTTSDFSRKTYHGHSLSLENSLTWIHMVTKMKRPVKLVLNMLLSRVLRRSLINPKGWNTLPLADMDEKVIGERVRFWQDWMQHCSADDPWWAPMSFFGSIRHVRRPISMVAGWYDIFLPHQMHDFIALRKVGCESRITIGPWRHTDEDLNRAGVHDAIEWFDRHLRDNPPASRQKPVKLYVVGADEWREFDEWPPREAMSEHWYLHPERRLANQISTTSSVDQYRYDPNDPTPSIGGPALEAAPHSVDNAALEKRADVITYTSDPFAQQRDVIGPVIAELYVSSSGPSADFFVRLCDVDTQGVSRNICDGLQRVAIAASGDPQRIRVELWPTAYRIAQGHRLRLQISSGAFPRWARNLGGTEPIAKATELHTATQLVYHSPTQPSAAILPFCD